jgi:hypothetical protein
MALRSAWLFGRDQMPHGAGSFSTSFLRCSAILSAAMQAALGAFELHHRRSSRPSKAVGLDGVVEDGRVNVDAVAGEGDLCAQKDHCVFLTI